MLNSANECMPKLNSSGLRNFMDNYFPWTVIVHERVRVRVRVKLRVRVRVRILFYSTETYTVCAYDRLL